MRTLRLAALSTILGGAVVLTASGCDLRFNYLDDGFTKTGAVTEIQIERGGSGNVSIRADDAVKGVSVRRSVRYRGDSAPVETARVDGSRLVLDLNCGSNCSVSYEVRLPKGVTVRGANNSGNLELRGVGAVDLTNNSGNITIDGATGAVVVSVNSGNVAIEAASGDVTVTTSSGNVDASGLTGGTVTIEAESGELELDYAGTGTLSARTSSGNIDVKVPDGACRFDAAADSGNVHIDARASTTGTCAVTARADSGNVTISAR